MQVILPPQHKIVLVHITLSQYTLYNYSRATYICPVIANY